MKNNIIENNIPSGWQRLKLSNIFEFKNGLNKEKKYFGKGSPIINYTDVYKGGGLFQEKILGKVEVTRSEIDRFSVRKGDIFFTRTSETLEEIGFSAVALGDFENTVFSGFVLRARSYGNLLLPSYAKYYFKTPLARKEIKEKSSYTTRALTSGSSLNHVSILLPTLPEQNRIVSVLETWDRAIELLEKKIEYKKNVKKGLMQQLLTEKKRIDGFNDKWKVFKIGSMLKHVSVRNKDLEVTRVLSVTNRSGFVLPSDYFSRRVASEDVSNYKIVHKGDFAYNPSRINVGSIARLNEYEDGILSPMYVIFRTIDLLSSDYLLYWLDTKEANNKIKNSTSGSVRDSVDFTAFSDIELRLPGTEEQLKIVSILNVFEDEITILNKKLTSIKSQKKYLLNNLITGKIRTPENLTI